MDYTNDLHELCETIGDAIQEANEKVRSAGGKLSAGDVDYIDKLTHAMKSVKSTIAMIEDEKGYSGMWEPEHRGISYRGSYARGRGARRDSMGRYSSERGYSRNGDMIEEVRSLMEQAPDEKTRQEFRRFIQKLENA